MTRFHLPAQKPFHTLDEIDFPGKTFHLLGNFRTSKTKREFGESIENFGGNIRGLDQTKNLNFKVTDYFVVGDNHYRQGHKGNKISKIDAYNDKKSDKDQIPKISESHCLEHMNRRSFTP